MKKRLYNLLCMILALLFLVQPLAGCAIQKTDETIYLKKGEFFAYYVYMNNMTSSKYSVQEIENCEDGSVEGDILVEWGYIDEKSAKSGLSLPVDKETVVTVCANATFDLKEGNTKDIKDADLLDDPQLIANAYASGFFELENGYFDGAQQMTFADCEEIYYNSTEYAAGVHYEPTGDDYEMEEGVIVDDGSDYNEGDITIEFITEESTVANGKVQTDSFVGNMSLKKDEYSYPQVTFLGNGSGTDAELVTVATAPQFPQSNIAGNQTKTGFMATIAASRFEKLKLKIGDTVVLKAFEVVNGTSPRGTMGDVIGILTHYSKIGQNYSCVFEYPDFEQAAVNVKEDKLNASGVNKSSFEPLKNEYMGWKLTFECTTDSINVSATKDFTVSETDRSKDWQNAKKTVTATADFTMDNFQVDIKNIKSFANKKGSGHVKITADTDFSFNLEQSLRYTPDSNRNGKFPSNWSNSRWTDSDSKGAKEIKIARFTPTAGGIIGADVYIYLVISVDGKVSYKTSVDGGGVQIKTNNGKVSCTSLGKKTSELTAQVNLHGRVGVEASLTLFSFIDVITYDVGFDLDILMKASLYYENEMKSSGVFAPAEGLADYLSDAKFGYCVGVDGTLSISGYLEKSAVKSILDAVSKGTSLDFTIEVLTFGIHVEDGSVVDKCTRGETTDEKVEKSKDDDVKLDKYKITLHKGCCDQVLLTELPAKTKKIINSKNSITVTTKNKKIATAKYSKSSKAVIIEGVDEGSTEIVIKAKKGALWWKKTAEQKISVTVIDD